MLSDDKNGNDKYEYKNPKTLDVLLSVLQREFDNENDRIKIVDQRCTSLLALSGVGLVALTKFVDYSTYLKIPVLGTTLIILFIFLSISLICAIGFSLNVLRVRNYLHLNQQQLVMEDSINEEDTVIKDKFIQVYSDIISTNRLITDAKCNSFYYGLLSLVCFFVLLLAQFLILLVFKQAY